MNAVLGRSGMYVFVFTALLVLFNWPLLGIPGPADLPLWIFGVWDVAIVFLWFASRAAPLAGAEEDAQPRRRRRAQAAPVPSSTHRPRAGSDDV